MPSRKSLRSLGAWSLASALALGTFAAPAAAQACEERLTEIQDLIDDYDMDIPSGALNDIFTLQQQAQEACSGGSNDLAMTIADDLEETVHDAVEEGVPTVSPEDTDIDIGSGESDFGAESFDSGETALDDEDLDDDDLGQLPEGDDDTNLEEEDFDGSMTGEDDDD